MEDTQRPGFSYRAFKAYVRFYLEKVCYRKTYYLNMDNVPAPGTPLLIVSNHQNGASDPLGIVMSFRDRKPNVITRADVFALHPIANKFLRWLGLLPAFRINYEGEEALSNNEATFKISERVLLEGGTVAMYPESGHQDKHWLGTFSYGYTRLAFEAAEMGNFETEIFILPSCNHYSDYYGIRNDMLIRYGTPISLKPYYELYKTKPRTAQRQVNMLVRAQIESLMLNIDDLDNYDRIDFLRNTYGVERASANAVPPSANVNPGGSPSANVKAAELPAQLDYDKKLAAAIAAAKEADAQAGERGTQDLLDDTGRLMEGIRKFGIADRNFARKPGLVKTILKLLLAVILLPLGVFSMWPSLFMYLVAVYFSEHRMKDKIMHSTFLVVLSVLFWVPLFSVITFIVGGLCYSWWTALVWVLLFPVIFIFAWNYTKFCREVAEDISFLSHSSEEEVSQLGKLRASIHERLDKIMNRICKTE